MTTTIGLLRRKALIKAKIETVYPLVLYNEINEIT